MSYTFQIILGLLATMMILWLIETESTNEVITANETEKERQNWEKLLIMAREKKNLTKEQIKTTLHISASKAAMYMERLKQNGNLYNLGN